MISGSRKTSNAGLFRYMGCSPNYGPLLGIDSITAPNIYGCQNGTLILGTTIYGLGLMKICTGSSLVERIYGGQWQRTWKLDYTRTREYIGVLGELYRDNGKENGKQWFLGGEQRVILQELTLAITFAGLIYGLGSGVLQPDGESPKAATPSVILSCQSCCDGQ